MRTTMTALVVAGALLLGACGGDDDDTADEDKSTDENDTNTDVEADGPAADTPFCKDVLELFSNSETQANATDEAIAAARAIEPPAELAEDWDKWIGGVEQMSAPDAQLDPADPNAVASAEDVYESAQNVFTYIGTECGAPGFVPPTDSGAVTTTEGSDS